MNDSTRRENAVEATRGKETEAMVERIAGMKKEVDEKLQQIAAHGKRPPAASSAQTKPHDTVRARVGGLGSAPQGSTVAGTRTRNTVNTQPAVSRHNNTVTRSSALRVGGEVGKKRSRGQSGRFAAVTSSDDDSSSDEAEVERSPKKRRKDLEAVDAMDVDGADGATMVTDSRLHPRRVDKSCLTLCRCRRIKTIST
jgi:hypothetical protein